MLLFATAIAMVLVVSFLCSIFESVLLSINHAKIEALTERGKPAGRILAGFKRNIDRPIAAILIANTAAHTVGAAVAGATYADVFNEETLWLFTVVFTLAVLLFTEIIPKTLGANYSASLAVPVARGIQWLTFILKPLVLVSEKISSSLRGNAPVPVTSVDEIRLLAALGRNEGLVGENVADIIVGATRLRQMSATDAMIPRPDVRFLSGESSRDETWKQLEGARYSRYPFSPTQQLDDASGVVLVKDLLTWLNRHPGEPIDWEALVMEPLMVPENTQLNALLPIFKNSRRHMALVVDEHGGIEGIVTLEDVLEEMVGEIDDETDVTTDDIRSQADGSLWVRANLDLRRLCNALEIEWRPDDDVATVSGLLVDELGRIPVTGDVITWRDHRFHVIAASKRRAELVRVVPPGPQGEEAEG